MKRQLVLALAVMAFRAGADEVSSTYSRKELELEKGEIKQHDFKAEGGMSAFQTSSGEEGMRYEGKAGAKVVLGWVKKDGSGSQGFLINPQADFKFDESKGSAPDRIQLDASGITAYNWQGVAQSNLDKIKTFEEAIKSEEEELAGLKETSKTMSDPTKSFIVAEEDGGYYTKGEYPNNFFWGHSEFLAKNEEKVKATLPKDVNLKVALVKLWFDEIGNQRMTDLIKAKEENINKNKATLIKLKKENAAWATGDFSLLDIGYRRIQMGEEGFDINALKLSLAEGSWHVAGKFKGTPLGLFTCGSMKPLVVLLGELKHGKDGGQVDRNIGDATANAKLCNGLNVGEYVELKSTAEVDKSYSTDATRFSHTAQLKLFNVAGAQHVYERDYAQGIHSDRNYVGGFVDLAGVARILQK